MRARGLVAEWYYASLYQATGTGFESQNGQGFTQSFILLESINEYETCFESNFKLVHLGIGPSTWTIISISTTGPMSRMIRRTAFRSTFLFVILLCGYIKIYLNICPFNFLYSSFLNKRNVNKFWFLKILWWFYSQKFHQWSKSGKATEPEMGTASWARRLD